MTISGDYVVECRSSMLRHTPVEISESIVWVDLEALDLPEGAPMGWRDLMGATALDGGLVGNVAAWSEQAGSMTFLALPPDSHGLKAGAGKTRLMPAAVPGPRGG